MAGFVIVPIGSDERLKCNNIRGAEGGQKDTQRALNGFDLIEGV
jgi:hypothetical protein